MRQSVRNTVITYIGFGIGAINALFMYPHFLGKTYYGLTAFLLSSANIMMPLMAFGVHNTLVKFYSGYPTEKERAQFLGFMLILPLMAFVPIGIATALFYPEITAWLSDKNPVISGYVWLIAVIGCCMGYFEVFYAWVKVHMKSVYGNFIREVLLRLLISVFLLLVYFGVISTVTFIYATAGIYLTTTVMMAVAALRIKMPEFDFSIISRSGPILVYSVFIILSGSVAVLLLDIDKFMLGKMLRIDNVAYYSVAIFIATVVAVPSRAMHQITYPITAKLMHEGKQEELDVLYKKSSASLQVIGGYVLLGILINIHMLYELLPEEYSKGVFVVFAIGLSKYFDLMLGNNNAIIFNSRYYRMVLALGLLLGVLAVGLNYVAIPRFGIDGAAMATLISIVLYSLAKLLFVVFKMGLFPFTRANLYALAIGLALFGVFYFWDLDLHPVLSIAVKSVLMSLLYWWAVLRFRVSEDISALALKILPSLGKRA